MQFKIKVDNSHGMESTNLQNVRNAKEEKRAEQRERERVDEIRDERTRVNRG